MNNTSLYLIFPDIYKSLSFMGNTNSLSSTHKKLLKFLGPKIVYKIKCNIYYCKCLKISISIRCEKYILFICRGMTNEEISNIIDNCLNIHYLIDFLVLNGFKCNGYSYTNDNFIITPCITHYNCNMLKFNKTYDLINYLKSLMNICDKQVIVM